MSLVHIPKPLQSLSKKYGCIVADPPWEETGGGKIKRGADRHYPLMKVREIAALPVLSIVPENAHLYLWITNNFLAKGAQVEVARAWGFRPVTVLTWKKKGRIGLGQYFRGTTEHVVFCVRGAPPYRITPEGKRAQGVTDFDTDSPDPLSIDPDMPMTAGECVAREALQYLEGEEARGLWWEEERPGAHSRKPTKPFEWAQIVSPEVRLEMFAREYREGWDAWGNQAPEEDPLS